MGRNAAIEAIKSSSQDANTGGTTPKLPVHTHIPTIPSALLAVVVVVAVAIT